MTAKEEYIAKAPNLTIYDGFVKTESVLEKYKTVLVSVSGGSDSDDLVDIVEHLSVISVVNGRKRAPQLWL